MIIKCGRREFEVTREDRILDNGSCYQLITQTYIEGFSKQYPIVSKTMFKNLFKNGEIIKSVEKYKDSLSNKECDLYEFTK